MIIDKDRNGNISIVEMTVCEAEVLQIAALSTAENQHAETWHSNFLRRVAIAIDKQLPEKPATLNGEISQQQQQIIQYDYTKVK